MLGNTQESDVGEKLPEVLFELYKADHELLTPIIPVLDQKLKVPPP